MPNEDNTQQMSSSNSQMIAAIRALEDRVASVEGIVVARLNDTRPFEQQVLARLNELIAGQSAMRDELTALREDFESFRRETNDNFRLVNNKLDVLNQDVLTVRAQQRDLEKRVTRLEQEPIESAA